jgi:transposase-like protein
MASISKHASKTKSSVLVLMGATSEGRKELVGFTDGARESAQDWRDLLLDRKRGVEALENFCTQS